MLLALLIPDILWYWVHRLSHEGRGRSGQWMWKMHLAHHLPQQVYLLMHAVAHPLNTIIECVILPCRCSCWGSPPRCCLWPAWWWGCRELHRYHHSADPPEAKNYAAVVTLWDLLFGTFYYRPGVVAQRLGLEHPAQHPEGPGASEGAGAAI